MRMPSNKYFEPRRSKQRALQIGAFDMGMKRVAYMGIISALAGLFGAKGNAAEYELAETYIGLRAMVFETRPCTACAEACVK